jgi:hypothetical protein
MLKEFLLHGAVQVTTYTKLFLLFSVYLGSKQMHQFRIVYTVSFYYNFLLQKSLEKIYKLKLQTD